MAMTLWINGLEKPQVTNIKALHGNWAKVHSLTSIILTKVTMGTQQLEGKIPSLTKACNHLGMSSRQIDTSLSPEPAGSHRNWPLKTSQKALSLCHSREVMEEATSEAGLKALPLPALSLGPHYQAMQWVSFKAFSVDEIWFVRIV